MIALILVLVIILLFFFNWLQKKWSVITLPIVIRNKQGKSIWLVKSSVGWVCVIPSCFQTNWHDWYYFFSSLACENKWITRWMSEHHLHHLFMVEICPLSTHLIPNFGVSLPQILRGVNLLFVSNNVIFVEKVVRGSEINNNFFLPYNGIEPKTFCSGDFFETFLFLL